MKRRLAVAFLPMVFVAACGVPTDGSPRSVDPDALPSSLTDDAVASDTTRPGIAQQPVEVYFIRDDAVVPATERVDAPADLRSVLLLLERGPTTAQADRGLRSALSGTELIRTAARAGSTAFVDLDSAFVEISPADQIVAIGQIVLTATSQPGVERVRLTVDGEPTQVPTGDGSLTTQPLRRADYENLRNP